jgi:hypothetical protein
MASLNKIEANKEEFMNQFITGDETWIYQYDLKVKFSTNSGFYMDHLDQSNSNQRGLCKR